MARKGGVQQLQTKITTNDELDEYLQRGGLVLLEVYTEWFGPCTPMMATLRKVKMEMQGDDLHLGMVQCDNIDVFKRFVNKSEPVWLFVIKGKVVNSIFGSTANEISNGLKQEIAKLPEYESSPLPPGTFRELHELSSLERQRIKIEKMAKKSADRQREEEESLAFLTRMRFVSDKIMHHMSDMGVTVLLPHVMHGTVLKEVEEAGANLRMTAKDKLTIRILPEHWKVMNFDGSGWENSVPKALWHHIVDNDVSMICWKISDDELRPVEELCGELVKLLTDEGSIEGEGDGMSEASGNSLTKLKPILVRDPIEEDDGDAQSDDSSEDSSERSEREEIIDVVSNEQTDAEEPAKELSSLNIACRSIIDRIFSTETLRTLFSSNDNSEQAETQAKDLESPDSGSEVTLQGIWTPANKKTNAMLIYLYFRYMTEHFLPSDLGSDRPHLLMVFDVARRRSILPLIEKHRSDVLAYGYFTYGDNINTGLVAKTNKSYERIFPIQQTPGLKLVLKVANQTDDALYGFANCEPVYISRNTEIGKIECETFFPNDYPTNVDNTDLVIGQASFGIARD